MQAESFIPSTAELIDISTSTLSEFPELISLKKLIVSVNTTITIPNSISECRDYMKLTRPTYTPHNESWDKFYEKAHKWNNIWINRLRKIKEGSNQKYLEAIELVKDLATSPIHPKVDSDHVCDTIPEQIPKKSGVYIIRTKMIHPSHAIRIGISSTGVDGMRRRIHNHLHYGSNFSYEIDATSSPDKQKTGPGFMSFRELRKDFTIQFVVINDEELIKIVEMLAKLVFCPFDNR